jgi:hypothetical protein
MDVVLVTVYVVVVIIVVVVVVAALVIVIVVVALVIVVVSSSISSSTSTFNVIQQVKFNMITINSENYILNMSSHLTNIIRCNVLLNQKSTFYPQHKYYL